jgi:hypothetical protein
MKILHISLSDLYGDAARAGYRLHRALIEAGLMSRMWVQHKVSDDWTVKGREGKAQRVIVPARKNLGAYAASLQGRPSAALHSVSMLPSRWAQAINRSDDDVVNLHWVNSEMMSVEDIGRIRKPLVRTLHDMWAFCGAEHYATDGPEARWRRGYNAANRPARHSCMDVDRWTRERKRRAWRKPMHSVCPSNWLARCAGESALMHEWSVSTIPHTLVQKNKLRSPLRPVVATQNDARVLEHLRPPMLRCLYLALRAMGWPTP